jgi:hypothetical protein
MVPESGRRRRDRRRQRFSGRRTEDVALRAIAAIATLVSAVAALVVALELVGAL